jgi:serine/threonine protein phosphatase PrpC
VVAPVIFDKRLYWVSVGDSPLFLYRGGKIQRLNEDHSMAPQIDAMAKMGQMDPDVARNHPDRSSLLSVLIGSSIPKLDCKSTPVELKRGDIVVVASDGVMTLDSTQMAQELSKIQKRAAGEIAVAMIGAVQNANEPKQDNISLSVIKVI